MTCREWREAYENLAALYFQATGELIPRPDVPGRESQFGRLCVSDDLLRKLYVAQGLCYREIAELLGCSVSTVGNMIKKAGIKKRNEAKQQRLPPQKRETRFYKRGYVYLYLPESPMANRSGCVAEHRLVYSAYIGRPLLAGEVIHHINGIKDDNRVENLMLMSVSEHNALTAKEHPAVWLKNERSRDCD